MKRWTIWIGMLAVLGLMVAGCGSGVSSSTAGTQVAINPTVATVAIGASQSFVAQVSTTSSNNSVNWQVNSVTGGNATVGTITTAGVYTAPNIVPTPNTVTVTAVSQADATATASATVTIDSGIRISINPTSVIMGTGETFGFLGIVTGSSNTQVKWSICQSNSTSGTNPGICPADTTGVLGTIDVNGNYHAPLIVPSNNPLTVQVVSVKDPNQFATATVTLQVAADPTVTSVYPTHVGQGAVFVDAYLQGTNMLSTSSVVVNGTALLGTSLDTGTVFRVRIPVTMMTASPTVLQLQVKRQAGAPVDCAPDITLCRISVDAVRPAIVAASPDSGLQGGPPVQFNIDGGFFGTNVLASSPSVTAAFDGSVRGATVNARQLNVTLGGTDLTVPGLHQVSVTNPLVTLPAALPQKTVVTNFSVQPSLIPSPGSLQTLAVGASPMAIAVNTATGIAVVANHNSNDLTLIDLNGAAPAIVPGGTIPVGNGPTGVAVDNVRNLAVVANNTDKTISVVNLATHTATTVSTQIPAAPYSVGVNPITGIALIAYQSTNIGALVDLTATPPTFIGAVTLGTGAKPQVAVMPGLNWGLVTPGGAGTFSIVDLARRNQSSIAAGGAVRVASTSTVTITTTAPHTLITGDAVLITGVTDTSFNGIFTVASVPSATTFTLTQTGADATSGGGIAFYSEPLATVAFGQNVSGIAVNPEAKQAFVTDATSQNPALIMSVLDQLIRPVSLPATSLAAGTTAVAVNPYTDIAVTINPATALASIIDPRTPTILGSVPISSINNPVAIAIDGATNNALIVDQGSNSVVVMPMGPIKPLHLESVVLPIDRQLGTDLTLSSVLNLPLTLIGKGFQAGSVARVDGFILPAAGTVTDRQMNVVVPASLLTSPRRFAVDVINPDGSMSNTEGFSVVQPVDLTSAGCPSPSPSAVAIDDVRNLALVTEASCNSAAVIDLATGAVLNTLAVGNSPQGVAIQASTGFAVVTNRGDNTATILDLADTSQDSGTVAVGIEPIGVAISPIDGTALVANSNSNSNSVSVFSANLTSAGTVGTETSVGGAGPIAIAIDPINQLALVANATSSTMSLLDISVSPPALKAALTGPTQPTGVVFDPATSLFVVTSSEGNSVFFVNSSSQQVSSARIGINPTSIAYNYISSTLVTVNGLSSTISVMDILDQRVKANMGLTGSVLGAVAIHPKTNLALVVDQTNNRLLMVPLPN